MNAQARFDEKCIPVPESGCLLWLGQWGATGGYGVFFNGEKQVYAHRYSYEQANGPVPDGLVLRHKCDTRCCVEPAHLVLGTHAQNSADMVQRGRSAVGLKNGSARLTAQQVQAIRDDVGTYSELEARHGAPRSHIWNIKHGKKRENA